MVAPANLIEAWIAVSTATPGRTLADAVRDIAAATGRPIRQNRIYEWRDGKRTPPPNVLRAMARVVAPRILGAHGISARSARAIADALTPPDKITENNGEPPLQ